MSGLLNFQTLTLSLLLKLTAENLSWLLTVSIGISLPPWWVRFHHADITMNQDTITDEDWGAGGIGNIMGSVKLPHLITVLRWALKSRNDGQNSWPTFYELAWGRGLEYKFGRGFNEICRKHWWGAHAPSPISHLFILMTHWVSWMNAVPFRTAIPGQPAGVAVEWHTASPFPKLTCWFSASQQK